MIHVLGTIKAWSKKGAALTKCNEALKTHNKAIEINSQDSYAWYKKGALSKQSN